MPPTGYDHNQKPDPATQELQDAIKGANRTGDWEQPEDVRKKLQNASERVRGTHRYRNGACYTCPTAHSLSMVPRA